MGLYEKIHGCLGAGAIGNAMGHPVENWHYEEIKKKYGTIESLLEPESINIEDDYKFVLWLCRAYSKKGGRITPEDWAQTWLEEMDPVEMKWVRNVYELLYRGYSPRLTGFMNINHGAAIMCVAPIGIYNAGDVDNAYIDALDLGYMQQPEQDTTCSAVMASCFATALKPDATIDDVISVALSKAPKSPYHAFVTKGVNSVYDFVNKAVDISRGADSEDRLFERLYESCLMWDTWDPMEVLALTLAVLTASGGNVRKAIVLGTNIGRDSDTIANLAGGLAGAIAGFDQIPREWLDQLPDDSLSEFTKVSQGMFDLVRDKFREMQQRIELFDGEL